MCWLNSPYCIHSAKPAEEAAAVFEVCRLATSLPLNRQLMLSSRMGNIGVMFFLHGPPPKEEVDHETTTV